MNEELRIKNLWLGGKKESVIFKYKPK